VDGIGAGDASRAPRGAVAPRDPTGNLASPEEATCGEAGALPEVEVVGPGGASTPTIDREALGTTRTHATNYCVRPIGTVSGHVETMVLLVATCSAEPTEAATPKRAAGVSYPCLSRLQRCWQQPVVWNQ
jgi:hypothetical protein